MNPKSFEKSHKTGTARSCTSVGLDSIHHKAFHRQTTNGTPSLYSTLHPLYLLHRNIARTKADQPAARKAKAEKTEKEVAEKKTTKRTTKKAVKTTFVVQAAGKEVSMEDATAKVKEAWVAEGNKEADLKEITLYVKPEENAIYYVVNGDVTGRVDF